MTASQGVGGLGTQVLIGDGEQSETFLAIAELRDISGPNLQRSTFDKSTQLSPGGWEEMGVALKSAGQITFDVNFVPELVSHDEVDGLVAHLNGLPTDQPTNFVLAFNTGKAWKLPGYVVGINLSMPLRDAQRGAITIQVAGVPDFNFTLPNGGGGGGGD